MIIRFLFSRLFSLRLVVVASAALLALALLPAGLELPFITVADRMLFDLVMASPDASVPLAPPAFAALLQDSGIATSLWSQYAPAAALALATVFLVAVLPNLSTAMSVLIVLMMLATMVVAQSVTLLFQQQWLPLGSVVVFLAAGFVLMLFWLQPHREIRALRENVRDARYQLGRLLLQQGQADDALAALADCPVDAETLDLQYNIGLHQERKRQYDAAARTWRQILAGKNNFRDVKERLAGLETVNTGFTEITGAALEATRTLVLPDQAVSKPVLGRYEIERELGRGAMGVVYLGRDPKIARTVAIKTFSYSQYEGAELKDLKERFFREAEAAGRLNHPDIVAVYDVGEEADLAFIAMDFASGRPLSAHGKAGTLLPLPVTLKVIGRVAQALDYAHSQKIVHRDIKPGNIIFNRKTGELKITDFGIARIADDSRTRTGSVMGSPLYMSPEQLKGQKVTGASDIYSLGITLYRLVSGNTPFQADNLANLTFQVLNKRPRSVREYAPELPEGVVRIINRAIQRDPAKRFPSAAAMADALQKVALREENREVSG